MSRDRTRANPIVRRRWDRLCRWFAETPGVTTGTYRDHPPHIRPARADPLLPHDRRRTACRLVEQAVSNAFWGRR